jgi:hypothetical protein
MRRTVRALALRVAETEGSLGRPPEQDALLMAAFTRIA